MTRWSGLKRVISPSSTGTTSCLRRSSGGLGPVLFLRLVQSCFSASLRAPQANATKPTKVIGILQLDFQASFNGPFCARPKAILTVPLMRACHHQTNCTFIKRCTPPGAFCPHMAARDILQLASPFCKPVLLSHRLALLLDSQSRIGRTKAFAAAQLPGSTASLTHITVFIPTMVPFDTPGAGRLHIHSSSLNNFQICPTSCIMHHPSARINIGLLQSHVHPFRASLAFLFVLAHPGGDLLSCALVTIHSQRACLSPYFGFCPSSCHFCFPPFLHP
jgi:hypothetical protein